MNKPVAYRWWSSKWHDWQYTTDPLDFPNVPAGTVMEPLYVHLVPEPNPFPQPEPDTRSPPKGKGPKRQMNDRQKTIDTFYEKQGACCAGCDYWRHVNSVAGECTLTVPVSGAERFLMLGIQDSSLTPAPGHIMTPRNYVCGEFVDSRAKL